MECKHLMIGSIFMDEAYWWVFLVIVTYVSRFIPVLGVLILQRRRQGLYPPFLCKTCQENALWCNSCRYNLTKIRWIVCSTVFIIGFIGIQHIPLNGEKFIFLFFLFFLVLISLIDLWTKLIPNVITLHASCFFFLLRVFYHPNSLMNYIVTAICTLLLFFALCWLTEGMGGGDAKLLALCALVLGWPKIFLAFWIATISALFYICIIMLQRRSLIKKEETIPFGPHIAVGACVSFIYGHDIIAWYFSFIL